LSDIGAIAQRCQEAEIALIVDEAHGAHFIACAMNRMPFLLLNQSSKPLPTGYPRPAS